MIDESKGIEPRLMSICVFKVARTLIWSFALIAAVVHATSMKSGHMQALAQEVYDHSPVQML